MPSNVQQRMAALAYKIRREVILSAGKGLDYARVFLAARLKETMSVSAPRKRVTPAGGGIPYYRATTPATVGAPIRKVSGKAQQSVTSLMVSPVKAVVGVNAKSEKGFNYPKFHEIATPGNVHSGQHKFMEPTVQKYERDLLVIVGEAITIGG